MKYSLAQSDGRNINDKSSYCNRNCDDDYVEGSQVEVVSTLMLSESRYIALGAFVTSGTRSKSIKVKASIDPSPRNELTTRSDNSVDDFVCAPKYQHREFILCTNRNVHYNAAAGLIFG